VQKPKKVSAHRLTKLEAPEPNLTHSVICKEGSVEITLPIRTVSEGNCFEPWQKKHKRHKSQKRQISLLFSMIKQKPTLPCKLKFTRYAPRTLDKHDNLPISFKWLCDQICSELTGNYVAGRADDSDQIEISYDQVKSKEYGIKIQINF
tara:strand:+ start:2239 stop:2685 length:447 start_codon:yes stop_codon:yes gene_type:complete